MRKIKDKTKKDWRLITAKIILYAVIQYAEYTSTNQFIQTLRAERGPDQTDYIIDQFYEKRSKEFYALPIFFGEEMAYMNYKSAERKNFLDSIVK